jgi:hypothetical protein
MERLTTFVELAEATMGETYWVATGVVLAVVVLAYGVVEVLRTRIDRTLNPDGRPELRLFDLSHGDVAGRLRRKALVVPERLWSYDQAYLLSFATFAKGRPLGAGNALSAYIGPVLIVDIVFAIALALFAALLDFGVATALLAQPWAGRAVLVCSAMALLYGAADVAEDIKLRTILLRPHEIDAAETAAANALTRMKLVSLSLSISGVATFAALSTIAAVVKWGTKKTGTLRPQTG